MSETEDMKQPKKEQVQKKKFAFVADGQEVTTKRGQLKAGAQVFARDFKHGQQRINELLKIGALVEK